MSRSTIVVIDGGLEAESLYRKAFPAENVILLADPGMAMDLLFTTPVDIVIMDIDIPGFPGLALLETMRNYKTRTALIMLVPEDSGRFLIPAVDYGVRHFLSKPVDPDLMRAKAQEILTEQNFRQESFGLRQKIDSGYEFIGKGEYYNSIQNKIQSFKLEEPILITGEPGTEREEVALEIYKRNFQLKGPLIYKYLNKDELTDISFLYEAAHGFLILCDLSLLDAAEQQQVLSFINDLPVKVGLVFLTYRSLKEAVAFSKFNPDLYQKLSGQEIYLLPLRDRIKELPQIVEAYLKVLNVAHDFQITGINSRALLMLSEYAWPGNLLELKTVLFMMAQLRRQGDLLVEDLPLKFFPGRDLAEVFKKNYAESLK